MREWQNIFINKSTLWININGFITFRTVCWNYIFKIHWAARSGCELCLNGNQVPGKNLWTVTLAMFYLRVLLHDLCSNINGGSPTHFLNGSRGERKKTAAVNYLLHIFIDFSANRSLEWSFFLKGEWINVTLLTEVFEWTPFCWKLNIDIPFWYCRIYTFYRPKAWY